MLFFHKNKETLRRGISFGEVSRKVADEWRNLPEKEKELYNKMALEAKEEYELQLKIFNYCEPDN